jgi:hypothetical protein
MNPQFMPQFAPLVVLAFLGTCFLLFVLAVVTLVSLLLRKWWVVKFAALGAGAVIGVYAFLLFGASFMSEETALTPNGKKYFCEIDCHIAYSIESVTTAKTVGVAPQQAAASGTFYVVKVKTWFDENTISSHRPKDAPLTPNPRRVSIVDEQGHEYALSSAVIAAVRYSEANSSPLTRPLRPGESYTTDLVFDLPDSVRNARLFITDDDAVSALLIGHENSPLHKRILFQLDARAKSAAR